MRKIQLALIAVALGLAMQAQAAFYNLTFSGSGSAANGLLDISGGFAISGNLNITAGPDVGTYALVPGSGNTGDFTYDSVVNPGSTPFLSSSGGLLWRNASRDINMWYNADTTWYGTAGTYGLWGAPPRWSPQASGIATLTPVPEPATILAGALLLLPFGASTLRILRKDHTA